MRLVNLFKNGRSALLIVVFLISTITLFAQEELQNDNALSQELILTEGKSYYLEVEKVKDESIKFKLVDKLKNPNRTIIVRFDHEVLYGTRLTVKNPFKRKLDLSIKVKGEYTEYTDIIVLPLIQGIYQKNWSQVFMDDIIIASLQLRHY